MDLLLLIILVFVFGLHIGSFLNVLIIRSLQGESFVTGRSRCDSCHRSLSWYELVPLVSFIVLRGRCRTCGNEIDVMHPVVEFMTGALFVWWLIMGFAFFQLTTAPLSVIQPVFWLLVGIILLVIVIIDLRAWLIPDWSVLVLSFLTLAYRCVLILSGIYNPQDLARALAVASVALLLFLVLWIITGKQGLGFGDVKLVFALGLLMGWPDALVGIFAAFVLGSIVGIALILFSGAGRKSAVPFAPFLVAGTAVALLWGDSLIRWYITLL